MAKCSSSLKQNLKFCCAIQEAAKCNLNLIISGNLIMRHLLRFSPPVSRLRVGIVEKNVFDHPLKLTGQKLIRIHLPVRFLLFSENAVKTATHFSVLLNSFSCTTRYANFCR